MPRFFSFGLAVGLFAGAGVTPAQVRDDGAAAFRVRSDFTAGLNADAGWARALNEDVTIHADRPFRIRYEVWSCIRMAAWSPFMSGKLPSVMKNYPQNV